MEEEEEEEVADEAEAEEVEEVEEVEPETTTTTAASNLPPQANTTALTRVADRLENAQYLEWLSNRSQEVEEECPDTSPKRSLKTVPHLEPLRASIP